MENYRLPASNQLETAYNKGRLFVNSQEYVKEIEETRLKDILFMSREQENILDNMRIHEGEEKAEKRSSFKVYAAQIKTIAEAFEVYQAVAKNHISSTHVMCGFRIFGSAFHTLQDYVDAKEHGGGRKILEILKGLKVWNIIVVIVRYHNGPNLGPRRFEIIGEMVRQVVASFPGALNYGRYFTDQETLKALNEAAVKPEPKDKTQNARGRRPYRRHPRGGRRR